MIAFCIVAICSQGCANGTCDAPNVCTCFPGYHGSICNQSCPSNTWGPGCNNTCQCKNDALCDMRNGSCECLPGWQGRLCDQACRQGFHGNKCIYSCTCQNGAKCDHVTGNCTCSNGWQGQQCENPCHLGYYGNRCQETCQCLNDGKCDHVTGVCSCTIGYQGMSCERPCDSGYYGNGCAHECQCSHGSCDHVSGTCTCQAGYTGTRCNKPCPIDTFGLNCTQQCSCPRNASCNPIDGSCVCPEGYTGESCDQRCPSGYYGNNCQSKCSCHGDESCDHVNGNFSCSDGRCDDGIQVSHDKQTEGKGNPLLPIILSVTVILIISSLAIGYFVYRKRRNLRMRTETKPDELVYEFPEVDENLTKSFRQKPEINQQLVAMETNSPTYMELTDRHSNLVDNEGIQNPRYQTLTNLESRECPADDVSSVAMETQYIGISNPRDTYQSLDRDSMNQQGNTGNNPGTEGVNTGIYQPLSKKKSKSIPTRGNESESPIHYDNVHSETRENLAEDESDPLYLPLCARDHDVSDQPVYENSPPTGNGGQPAYEILPPTLGDEQPVYDNQ